MHFSRLTTSESETRLIGEALGRLVRGGDAVLLDGTLGAGKTTLVRAIASGMDLDTGPVASPTFVMIHEYGRPGVAAERPALLHVDAYRMSGPEDLDTVGWDRVLEELRAGRAAAVIEWADRLGSAAPAGARIRAEHVDETSRQFVFDVPDEWRTRPGVAALMAREATTCPVTGQPVPPDSPTYPFAHERARLADLYRWFSGSYTVSRDATEADFEEEPPPGPGR
jgi:tRNA threonylcarbamoyladenosine biosynthesis protein TsaE